MHYTSVALGVDEVVPARLSRIKMTVVGTETALAPQHSSLIL